MFFQGNEKYNCATYLRLSRSDGDQQEEQQHKKSESVAERLHGEAPGIAQVR